MRMTLDQYPEMLTFEEAAEYLRLAERWPTSWLASTGSPPAPKVYPSPRSADACAFPGGSWLGS